VTERRARGEGGAPAKKRGRGRAAEAVASPAAAPVAVPPIEEIENNGQQVRLSIPQAGFEGPLDLLLHLIQQHELDILNIPVSFVTRRFLEYIQLMQELSIDLASEYLVMAATLAHIKSKMLLPTVPDDQADGLPGEEEEDPRAELVRRLLEYQKYKEVAGQLGELNAYGRDVFGRGIPEPVPEGPAPFAATGMFSLLEAFEKVLKRTNVKIDHEVIFDRISITDRIVQLTERLTERKKATFEDLLVEPTEAGKAITKFDLVITFLAVLEMAKMRLIRVYQAGPLAELYVELAMSSEDAHTRVAEAQDEQDGHGTAFNEPPPPSPTPTDDRQEGAFEAMESADARAREQDESERVLSEIDELLGDMKDLDDADDVDDEPGEGGAT
jgi:segregation and condensation protein A